MFKDHQRPTRGTALGCASCSGSLVLQTLPTPFCRYGSRNHQCWFAPPCKVGGKLWGTFPQEREERDPTGTGTACMVVRAPSQPSHSLLLLFAFSRTFLWATAGRSQDLGARWSLGYQHKYEQPWSPSTTPQTWSLRLGNSAVPLEISPSL